MSALGRLEKKLQIALKMSGFNVRRELCTLLVEQYRAVDVQLNDMLEFETCVRELCKTLEQQCTNNKSIEREDVERAIKICIHSGLDRDETIFNVISAYECPKLTYDLTRQLYVPAKKAPHLLSNASSKAQMFLERYHTILHRTKASFKRQNDTNGGGRFAVQTIDCLLTCSNNKTTADQTLYLGALLEISKGKYLLEDPSCNVELDLKHAKYHQGFYVDNSFVLVAGYYRDKILHVSTMTLPPREEYIHSRHLFGNQNYFGGTSTTHLRESARLKSRLQDEDSTSFMYLFCEVWLNYTTTFEKLKEMFDDMQASPPAVMVFMGNFISQSHGCENIEDLKGLFAQLGQLISEYPLLVSQTQFVFVPGIDDPPVTRFIPSLPLPTYITEGLTKHVPKANFTTNPCRLQYCSREIVLFRADVLAKLLQATLYIPPRDEFAECVARTVTSQGHLSPFSLNALPVNWAFDHALRLYPLPDLIVIGDSTEAYKGYYKGCRLVSPGSFTKRGFHFKAYDAATNTLQDCTG